MTAHSPDKKRSPSPQSLWKEQEMTSRSVTADQLDRLAHDFEKRLRRRNLFEYLAGGAVTLFGLGTGSALLVFADITVANAVLATGLLLLGVASLFVSAMLHLRGTPKPISGATASREHYRAELIRQRDALRSVWLWYVAPFLPPILLIYGSNALRDDGQLIVIGGLFAATLFFMGLVVAINRRAAAALDKEIEALDRD